VSIDTTISFNTTSGYTLTGSFAVVSSAWMSLTGTGAASGTIKTPNLNTTTWGAIHNVTVTATETCNSTVIYQEGGATKNYFHRYLCSFDNGTKWWAYRNGSWQPVTEAAIEASGMTQAELEAVRDWTKVTTQLRFMVFGRREATGSGTGKIDLLSIDYGARLGTFEVEELNATDDSLDDLVIGGIDAYPDRVMAVEYMAKKHMMRSAMGYPHVINASLFARRSYDCSWTNRHLTTHLSAVKFFLENHMDAGFNFQPDSDGNVISVCASEIEISEVDRVGDVCTLHCKLTEVIKQ
jgi:hypothetical protein